MKKKIVGVLLLLIGLFISSNTVYAEGITDHYDDLFTDNKFSVYTDKDFEKTDIGFSNLISSMMNDYSFSEYYTNPDNSSMVYLNVENCVYSTKTCDFKVVNYKTTDGIYSQTTLKPYPGIKVTIINDVDSYFPFLESDGSIKINYDESLFNNDEEKQNYIWNYFPKYNVYDQSSGINYSYDTESKTLKRRDYVDYSYTTKTVSKKVENIKFEFTDTPFSTEFKKLTDGTLTIKTDADIDTDIVSQYIQNVNSYLGGKYSFSIDGSIVNGKGYVKMTEYTEGGSVEKEKHLITFVKDSSINLANFSKVNMGEYIDIYADKPSSIVSNYISNYTNSIPMGFEYEDGTYESYMKYNPYQKEYVIVTYIKTQNGKVIDVEIHKVDVRFKGYNSTISSDFKLGTKLTIKSDTPNESAIRNSIGYDYTLLSCNDSYTSCDVGKVDSKNYKMEIHKVNIVFDNSFSLPFMTLFNLNSKKEFTIYTDKDLNVNSYWYSSYDDKNNISLNYNTTNIGGETKIELGYKDYSTGYYESHTVPVKYEISPVSNYYKSHIYLEKDFYPGDTKDYMTRLTWSNRFSINPNSNVYPTTISCSKKDSTCNVMILNDKNQLEVHKVKANIKEGKSPEYKAIFGSDTIELNAAYKDDEDYIFKVSMAYLMSKTKTWSFLEEYKDGKGRVMYDDFESHYVNVKFAESNPEEQKIVEEAIKELDKKKIEVTFTDMEFVNNFYYNGSELGHMNFNSKQLNDAVRKVITNDHIGYFYVPMGGGGMPFEEGMGGTLAIYYDGNCYGTTNNETLTGMHNVIYIPDNTIDTIDAYVKAAQRRVDEYLGKNSGVSISYSRKVNDDELEYSSIDLSKHDGNVYLIKHGEDEKEFLIIKDSSKMQDSTFIANDVNNNVTVSSDNANYPTNTIVSSDRIEKDSKEYKNLLKQLGVKDAEIIDIDLYSSSIGDIKDFEGTDFSVYLPINNKELEGKELWAYYIDDKGNIEAHKVIIKNGFARFETTHFSTYIISEKIDDSLLNKPINIPVPNTYDDILVWSVVSIISLCAVAGIIVYKKKFSK